MSESSHFSKNGPPWSLHSPGTDSLPVRALVPAALIGPVRKAKRGWSTIAAAAVESGSWDPIMRDSGLVAIDDAPGPIILHNAQGVTGGEQVLACLIFDGLSNACRADIVDLVDPQSRRLWYTRLRDLTLSALNEFWMCLGLIGAGSAWFPMKSGYEEEERTLARLVLAGLLQWWPEFCRLENRFATGLIAFRWPFWGTIAMHRCMELGVPDAQRRAMDDMTSVAAGEELSKLLTHYS